MINGIPNDEGFYVSRYTSCKYLVACNERIRNLITLKLTRGEIGALVDVLEFAGKKRFLESKRYDYDMEKMGHEYNEFVNTFEILKKRIMSKRTA